MNVPSGYSALDLVGFTDKGDYSPSATYVKNDLVHYNDKIWKCLIDDTTGIVPISGVNWDIWIDQSNSLDGLVDVEITNATDGQEVTYDATTQKWKNTSKIQTLTNQVEDVYEVMGQNGAKNLLPPNNISQTIRGVTFTPQSDGSVIANGTQDGAGGGSYYHITDTFEGEGNYIINGCPSGGSSSKYRLYIWDNNTHAEVASDIGNGASATLVSGHLYTINIMVGVSQTVSNLTFKPMIRLASDTDPTYQPFAETNQQLTSKTDGLLDNMMDCGAVNLLQNTLASQTYNGVTFTVNSDGSVTANGTASANIIVDLDATIADKLVIGQEYKLTGCPQISNILEGTQLDINGIVDTKDTGNGATFACTNAMNKARLRIQSGQVLNNVIFKPMLSHAPLNLSYDDYVPYAKTNRDLTEDVSNLFAVTTRNGSVFDIAISGGYGGNNNARALVLGVNHVGLLTYSSNVWNYVGVVAANGITVTESNKSTNGLRLTFSISTTVNIIPLNLGASNFTVTYVS